ncbi:hypothetical protein [Brachyspira aalborgi]|uniref:hypothetical protein n=1 Tax=Brachyspira aalborgi TaxID=29522 RepID=UPI00266639BF|nr:hypothetical protein [Brachyspira aalborgi]
MYKSNFGKYNQISFSNEHEYYQALGYLARNVENTSIHWEHNEEQGAWGSEGRIHFYVDNPKIPGYFSLTAGNGSIMYRTNCNEFVEHIIKYHNFTLNNMQNLEAILKTIPNQYKEDFYIGLDIKD